MPRPDVGLEVALEQRQRALELTQKALSERERSLAEHAQALLGARARVKMVLSQIDAAQRPSPGVALPVVFLADLERMLRWCDEQVLVHEARVQVARTDADEARAEVMVAHQQVKALELVLQARRAERAEKAHRAELRLADETAARVHARRVAAETR